MTASNTNKLLKLALVGCGSFPFNTLYPMLRNLPVELTGICDIDPAKTERFARFYHAGNAYTDYREMIRTEKPQAVICVTNMDVHYEAAKFCLENGVDVLTEKSPCRNAEQAEELAALQKKTGKFMGVAFNRRWGTGYALAKDVISRPEFGKITMFFAKFNTHAYRDLDFFVYNHIIHLFDLAVYLLGDIVKPCIQTIIHGEHNGAMAIHFTAARSGAICTIQSAATVDEAYPVEELQITGAGGDVIVHNWRDFHYNRTGPQRDIEFFKPLENTSDNLSWNPAGGYGIGRGIFSYMGFEPLLAEFVDSALEGKKYRCTIEDCVPTMKFTGEVRKLAKEAV
jgi:predicted dehydrogenase